MKVTEELKRSVEQLDKVVSKLVKGDLLGHPFRGNQWTGGTGGMAPDTGGSFGGGGISNDDYKERKRKYDGMVESETQRRMKETPSRKSVMSCTSIEEVKQIAQKINVNNIQFEGYNDSDSMLQDSKAAVAEMVDAVRNCPAFHQTFAQLDAAEEFMPEMRGLINQKKEGVADVDNLVLHTGRLKVPNATQGVGNECCGYYIEPMHNYITGARPCEIHVTTYYSVGKGRSYKLKVNDHTVDDSFAGTVRHELGHHVSRIISKNNWRLAFKLRKEYKSYAKKVSHYAGTNTMELEAEMFSAATHPKFKDFIKETKPTPIMKKFYALFNQEIK